MMDWDPAQILIGIMIGILLSWFSRMVDDHLQEQARHTARVEGRVAEMWDAHNKQKKREEK